MLRIIATPFTPLLRGNLVSPKRESQRALPSSFRMSKNALSAMEKAVLSRHHLHPAEIGQEDLLEIPAVRRQYQQIAQDLLRFEKYEIYLPWAIIQTKTKICDIESALASLRALPPEDRKTKIKEFNYLRVGELRSRVARVNEISEFLSIMREEINDRLTILKVDSMGEIDLHFTREIPANLKNEISSLEVLVHSLEDMVAGDLDDAHLQATLDRFPEIPFWWVFKAWNHFSEIKLEFKRKVLTQIAASKPHWRAVTLAEIEIAELQKRLANSQFLYLLVKNPLGVLNNLPKSTQTDFEFFESDPFSPGDEAELAELSELYRNRSMLLNARVSSSAFIPNKDEFDDFMCERVLSLPFYRTQAQRYQRSFQQVLALLAKQPEAPLSI